MKRPTLKQIREAVKAEPDMDETTLMDELIPQAEGDYDSPEKEKRFEILWWSVDCAREIRARELGEVNA